MKSKKIVLASIFTLLLLANINTSQAQVKFGPIAGLNFADMTGDVNSDGMLIGFHLGVLVNLPITDYFMIEPQLLYSTKGAKGKGDDLNLNYVEIPIWVRYQLDNGLNFNAGPYFGVLVSAKAGDDDVKDAYTGLDYGLAAAIGYQMEGGLGFSAGYFAGIADIAEDQDIPFLGTIDYNAKVNVIKLSISYTLGGRRN